MSTSKLFSNSLFYTIIGLFPVALGFFTLPVLTRYLTPDDYGTLALISTFISTLSIAATFQLYSGVSRFFFDYDDANKKIYFSTLFYSITAISLVVLFVLCICGEAIIGVMFKTELVFYPYIFIAMLNVFFSLPLGVTTAFFKVQEKGRPLLYISTFSSIVGVASTLYLVVGVGLGMLGSLVGSLITLVVAYVLHILHLRKSFVFAYSASMFFSNLKFGIPVIPHAIGGYLFMYSDKLILDKHVAIAAIGIYAIADRFASLYKTVVNSFAGALSPLFMRASKQTIKEGQTFVLQVSGPWFIALGLGYFALCNFGEYVVYIMTPTQYHEASQLIPILAMAYVFRGIYIFPINTFYFSKNTKYLPIATVTSGVLNVVLNLVLIPIYGIKGAAVTTVISFAFNWLALEWLTVKTFRLKYNKQAMALLFCMLALTNLLFYGVSSDNNLVRLGIQSATFISILLAVYILNIAGVKSLLHHRALV